MKGKKMTEQSDKKDIALESLGAELDSQAEKLQYLSDASKKCKAYIQYFKVDFADRLKKLEVNDTDLYRQYKEAISQLSQDIREDLSRTVSFEAFNNLADQVSNLEEFDPVRLKVLANSVEEIRDRTTGNAEAIQGLKERIKDLEDRELKAKDRPTPFLVQASHEAIQEQLEAQMQRWATQVSKATEGLLSSLGVQVHLGYHAAPRVNTYLTNSNLVEIDWIWKLLDMCLESAQGSRMEGSRQIIVDAMAREVKSLVTGQLSRELKDRIQDRTPSGPDLTTGSPETG